MSPNEYLTHNMKTKEEKIKKYEMKATASQFQTSYQNEEKFALEGITMENFQNEISGQSILLGNFVRNFESIFIDNIEIKAMKCRLIGVHSMLQMNLS